MVRCSELESAVSPRRYPMSRFCALLLLLVPVGDGKEVHTLSLPKYLTGCAPSSIAAAGNRLS